MLLIDITKDELRCISQCIKENNISNFDVQIIYP